MRGQAIQGAAFVGPTVVERIADDMQATDQGEVRNVAQTMGERLPVEIREGGTAARSGKAK